MKTSVSRFFIIAALAAMLSACSTDDAVEVRYGVYASPDLLALSKAVVTVTNSNGKTSTIILTADDFKPSSDLNISAGETEMLYWTTTDHFDKFGVTSSLSVIFKPLDGVDLESLDGDVVLGHGIVGTVSTQDKDGDFYDVPIYQASVAERFSLPENAGAVKTYLIDLANTPDVVTVAVDNGGVPTVKFP